ARRFGDESLGYSGFARVVLEHGDFAYAVFDRKIFDIAAQEEEFAELAGFGGLKQAETAEALAEAYGLAPA
ncbi:hypothetical protein, partial [Providencia stuartii]